MSPETPDKKKLPDVTWLDRVQAMIEDIDRIGVFLGTLDRMSFCADERTVFAVCYAFVRLGEGSVHIPAGVKASHPGLPWNEVRHFKNFMVHVYLAVDPGRVYDTAKADLPSLRASLAALLTRPSGSHP